MYNRLRDSFVRYRHSLAVFFLLNAACGVCIFLVAARVAFTETGYHLGLIWNLFLAWIPFILSYLAHSISWRRFSLYLVIPIIAIFWLLFFPNAPYMLTDLQDLARRTTGAPLWYDVIIVVWCSWTAMLLGVISLYIMQDIVQRTFGRFIGWSFVFTISALGSFGVYVGRFVRLNSWDILQDPAETAMEILGIIIDPSRRLAAFLVSYTVFFLFVYLLLYSFSRMLQEQNLQAGKPTEQIAPAQPNHVPK
jgi:uncharacterized membrane protein